MRGSGTARLLAAVCGRSRAWHAVRGSSAAILVSMPGLGFGGEVAELYARFRRGYPPGVVDTVAGHFGLTRAEVVVDLGCGTGQLALPISQRVGAVIGVDPEPDMLAQARRAAEEHDARNLLWILGSDRDMPALGRVLGLDAVGAVVIGQALHWMEPESLFGVLVDLVRPGGGVAVITNGTPLWLQESPWSVALREFLQTSFGWTLDATCGTDDASQARYHRQLTDAGFDVVARHIDYEDDLDLDSLVGGLLSAFPVQELPPPERRHAFAARVAHALAPETRFTEHVRVSMLLGRTTARPRLAADPRGASQASAPDAADFRVGWSGGSAAAATGDRRRSSGRR
jgi:SAM-dependent methyltransferase